MNLNNFTIKAQEVVQAAQQEAFNLKNPQNTMLFDAGHDDGEYNMNSFPSQDPQGQYIGSNTPLDEMNDYQRYYLSTDNAMMDNWDNSIAEKHIAQGVYDENNVNIYVP